MSCMSKYDNIMYNMMQIVDKEFLKFISKNYISYFI